MLSAQGEKEMTSAMEALPEVGMMVQGVMGRISALFINIGKDVLPVILPAILAIVDALSKIWEEHGPAVTEALQTLVNEALGPFLDILGDVGGELLTGFINGLTTAIQFVVSFLEMFAPFGEQIGHLAGVFLGFAPIMTIIGAALYTLSVPVQLISALFSGVGHLISFLGAAFQGLLGSVLPANVVLLALAVIVAGIIMHFDRIKKMLTSQLGPAFNRLREAIGRLGEALTESGEGKMSLLEKATLPVLWLITGLTIAVRIFTDVLTWLINRIVDIIDYFQSWTSVIDVVKEKIDAVRGAFKTFGKIASWLFGNSVGDDIKVQMTMASDSFDEFRENVKETNAELNNIPRTIDIDVPETITAPGEYIGPTEQEFNITIDINVENMSSDTDVEDLAERISRTIAERIG